MIVASIEALMPFRRKPCIDYPVLFRKNHAGHMSALIDSYNEVNTMYPTYAKKLGLDIRKIDLRAQKIDGTTLKTFEIVIAAFSVYDKVKKVFFFEETLY